MEMFQWSIFMRETLLATVNYVNLQRLNIKKNSIQSLVQFKMLNKVSLYWFHSLENSLH